MPRLDKLKAAFGDSADFQQVLGLIYSDVLEFHQRAYKMFRRKGWHVWFMFDWGLFERRFKSILQRLASHCDLLDKEAAATHYLEMKGMWEKRKIEEESYEKQRNNQLTVETLGWLSADEDAQEEFLHRLPDQRQLGTCDWILSETQVTNWLGDDDRESTVWLSGIPGAGKSFLCSLVVQNSEIHPDRSTIYYFCGERPSGKDAATALLRTLAVQLLRQNLELAPLIHQAFVQQGQGRSAPTIKKILKEIVCSVKASRMVLDGIDEWDHTAQRDTLKALFELQKHGGNKCKLLVSSRKEPSIGKFMPQKAHMDINMQSVEGLHRYIRSNTEELRDRFPDFAPSIWGRVSQNLQDRAQGMFLWVRLVKTMLEDCSSQGEFELAIEQLPHGLDEAYGRILSRLTQLSPILRERALKVLFWVCIAYRSVSIHEVVDGIALKPGQTQLCPKNISQNPDRDILELCAPLLEKTQKGTLDLVHFSAKEYLLHMHSGPFIDASEAHFNIAYSCIVNLKYALVLVPSLSGLATETDIERSTVTGAYGLHSYAHQYWAEHLAEHFSRVQDLDNRSLKLMGALDGLSRVLKGQSLGNVESFASLQRGLAVHGLQKLQKFPTQARLVSVWKYFTARVAEMASTFENIDAQETFLLQNDQTYLSLFQQRLRGITERLLRLDRSALPSHVQESDHTAFVARFGFSCRVHGCTRSFSSVDTRTSHELSHNASYPCLQCDFSGRGFKSKEILRKHTQRYHMSPEDFEIPESLASCQHGSNSIGFSSPGSSARSVRISQSWTEQGRRASQQSFQHILTTVKSRFSTSFSEIVLNNSMISESAVASDISPMTADDTDKGVVQGVDTIRAGIKEQRYHTLRDFKDDLQNLLRNVPPSGPLNIHDEVDMICDEALEKVISDFPAFAKADSAIPKPSINSESPKEDLNMLTNYTGIGLDGQSLDEIVDPSPVGKRKTYWSQAEERELPELLNRYGRDLIKIADCLRTKTLDEIDVHLPPRQSDEAQTSEQEQTDLHIQSGSLPAHTATQSVLSHYAMLDSSHQENSDLAVGSINWPPRYATQSIAASNNTLHAIPTSEKVDDSEGPAKDDKAASHPKKATRRPRIRKQCKFCLKECEDYALSKHIERFHVSTRKFWVCKDRSQGRSFLSSQCKACSTDKLYASKHNAMKHLREWHFADITLEQTLQRWMEQVEGPNPRYRAPESQASTTSSAEVNADDENTATIHRRTQKRRKIDQIAPIRQLSEPRDGLNRLPAIRSTLNDSRIASRGSTPQSPAADSDAESSDPVVSPLPEVDLPPHISFDHLLPLRDPATSNINDDIYDSIDKAWIRPSQVRRLRHLDDYQKALCLDQVEALYWVLTTQGVGNLRYSRAKTELSLLSRTILAGLRNWRQQSSLAPTLPVSI